MTSSTTGADAVDSAIAQGIDLDGTPMWTRRSRLPWYLQELNSKPV